MITLVTELQTPGTKKQIHDSRTCASQKSSILGAIPFLALGPILATAENGSGTLLVRNPQIWGSFRVPGKNVGRRCFWGLEEQSLFDWVPGCPGPQRSQLRLHGEREAASGVRRKVLTCRIHQALHVMTQSCFWTFVFCCPKRYKHESNGGTYLHGLLWEHSFGPGPVEEPITQHTLELQMESAHLSSTTDESRVQLMSLE